MTKLSSFVIASLLICSLQPEASTAAPAYPDKAYEAMIENYASGTNSTSHQWNDGRGHMRTETNVGGTNSISIIDFNAKMTYSINDEHKTVIKMPFLGSPENDTKVKWETIPGVRVIEGHPCSGKKGVSNGVSMEVWTGNDTGCSVLVNGNGKPMMKLKSWKAITPNPAMFTPPSGYKVQDMAEMMKNIPH